MKEKQLTDKQYLFCEEYLKDLNATQAAIRAGYSEKTAYSIGWENLRKPEIRGVISSRLNELTLTSEETLKSISDIAKSSLNDYFVVREIVRTPKIVKHLSQLIEEIQFEIEDADKFISRANITEEKRLENHLLEQESRRQQIIKYKIELERNPNANRIVNGDPEFVKVADLDLAKLVQDKEAGKIKSVAPTEFGTKVEMYAADAALRDLAKIHGLYEKDNKQKSAITFDIGFDNEDKP